MQLNKKSCQSFTSEIFIWFIDWILCFLYLKPNPPPEGQGRMCVGEMLTMWRCLQSPCVHLPPVLISRWSRPSCSPTCPASRTSPRDNCSGTTGQVWGLFVKTGPWESYLKHKHSLQLKSHQKVDILRLRSPHHRASESCKRYWENAVPSPHPSRQ